MQDTLFRTLKLHLIPRDRSELNQIQSSEQNKVPNNYRNTRSVLNELQKKSWGDMIEKVEKDINGQK